MNTLLNGALRPARCVVGAARRRLACRRDGDGGFVLLESIIAISLITVIMAAIGVEYVSGLAAVARQRSTQTAVQLADSALEQVRALRPSDLVTGRDPASVAAQFAKGNAIASITPWLQKMDQASDANAATTAGASATIPTCLPVPLSLGTSNPAACTQKPGTVPFTVSQFLGTCWLVSSGSTSNCLPAAQKTPTSVQYLRAVVAVSWTSGTCVTGCYYVTGTLISSGTDPTFKANQPPSPAPVISAPADQVNDVGDTVSLQLSFVTGTGIPGYSWAVTAGSLPSGLSMTSGGLISGVVRGPTGSNAITVQLTDGFGRTDTETFNWTVAAAPTIAAPPNQTTAINTTVNLQLTTTCANTPCTYALNNAPAGLVINNSGLITGTATLAGTSTTSVTVTDASKTTVTSASFTWTVLPAAPTCPPAVTLLNGGYEVPGVGSGSGVNVGNGTSGLAWRTDDANGQIEIWANGSGSVGNNNGVAIAATEGTQWIELNGSGMDTVYQDIATTPGQVLQWSLSHRARYWTGNLDAQDSMQVKIGSTTTQSAQVPNGTSSATISDNARAWGQYTGVYTVPAGQTTTRFATTATATSSGNGSVGNFVDNVAVTGTPCLAAQQAPQTSTVGTPITAVQLTASQGSGSYTWSGGSTLPAGLTLSSSGLITGTPTAVGASRVSLILTDSLSSYQQVVSFNWTVYPAPAITTPPNQTTTVGATVNVTVGSTCPNTPCTYTLNNAPAGLSMTGATVTGTPTTAGTTTSTVTIRDAAGAIVTTGSFTWTVYAAPTISNPNPGNAGVTVNTAIFLYTGSTCPNAPCTFSATGLPAGLSIDSVTGALSGTPTVAGAVSATVTIRDAAGVTASTSVTGTIFAAPTITTPSNQTTTVGATVNVTVGSTCPNTPCSYSATGLPAGLAINNSGVISGTPTTAGTTNVTVASRDASGVTATTGSFSWTVKAAPTITTPANQTTTAGTTVNLTVASTCPNTPCTYTLSNAPAGLTIDTSGVITGSPTVAGTSSSVTVRITDASGSSAVTNTFTWTVQPAPTITTPANQTSTVGATVNLGIGSTCPNIPCTYTLTNAPAGLTINAGTGVITGVPTTVGTSGNVTVRITDAGSATATTNAFSWTIVARPTITTPTNQTTTVGATVNLTVGSTCANTACTYAISGQPAGLSINNSGVITGKPTAVGTSSTVIATITDASGVTASTNAFTWTVKAAPTITTPANQTATVGAGVTLPVTATCGYPPCTYALSGAPAGLTINNTGVITGTPTAIGTSSSVIVTISNADGFTATTNAFTWAIVARPTITTPANQTTTVNATVNLTVGSTCPSTPCSYSATGLPAGLTINSSTAVISGTPTTPAVSNVTVSVRDASGITTTTGTFTWTVDAAPTITTPANQTTTVNATVNLTVGSTCPNTPCSYSATGLPAGLTINSSTAVISGTATTAGSSTSSVTVRDASGATATTGAFIWTVKAAPTITTPANQTTTVGATVNLTVASTCANTPCSYTLSNAPAGLSINTSGVITGSPTVAGTSSNVAVQITDAAGIAAATNAFTWTVKAAPTITTPANQTTTVNAAVNLSVAATCGYSPCTYAVSGAPAGLSINTTTGAITGRPTAVGTSSVTVTITDAGGATASTSPFSWVVKAAPTITTPANQTTTAGATVSLTVGSTCSNTPCTYALAGAPAGLSINNAGVISGTPTTAGTSSNVTVQISDASGVTATTGIFTWTVYAAPTISNPNPGNGGVTVNTPIVLYISSTCPDAPCTFSATGLPAGLSIDSATGTISGTPTVAGAVSATVTIRDAAGVRASTSLTGTIFAAPTIATPSNQTTTVGAAVNLTVGSTCPNTPCTYTASGLPAGLTINNSGVVSGTPTTAGTSSAVTVSIRDASGSTATTGAFTWTVKAGPTIVTPANQSTSVGAAVSVAVVSTCTNTPCTFTLTGAPAGLTINTAGVITGKPTAAGISNVTVQITDASGVAAITGTFTWTVKGAPTITTPANQTTSVAATVNLAVVSTCSNTPCTFSATGLPAGLTVNSASGAISGTPTTAGNTTTTVTITDSAGSTATTNGFTWTVYARPTITSPGNRVSTVNRPVSVTIASSCANTPCVYTASGLPAGLTVNSGSGVVTGTPTALGTSGTVTITITDAAGATTTTAAFSWQIVSAPTITTPANQASPLNSSPTLTVASTCPNSPCSYTLANGPSGLALNSGGAVTGTITGTSKVYSGVTVTVTDASGASQTTSAFTWGVTTTFAGALNNVGVTKSTNQASGSFDGSGSSYSYESIVANGGPAAGARFAVGGATYVWPTTAGSGSPDNVLTSGQAIAYSGSGSRTLSFLVAAAYGTASGTGTIAYADGTTQSYTLNAPDWWTAQTSWAIHSSNVNAASGTSAQNTYVVVNTVTLTSTKAISYITLPVPSGQLHVFGISQPPLTSAFNNVGVVTNSSYAIGNFDLGGNSMSYEGILARGGPPSGGSVTTQGASYLWPSTAGTGTVDNVIAGGQIIPFTASGGTSLSFLVSGTNGGPSSNGTIKYSDGTTQTFLLSADDWVTASPTSPLIAFSGANRLNNSSGAYSPAQPVYVESVKVAVSTSKTISQITLPNTTSNPQLHIFAIGYS